MLSFDSFALLSLNLELELDICNWAFGTFTPDRIFALPYKPHLTSPASFYALKCKFNSD